MGSTVLNRSFSMALDQEITQLLNADWSDYEQRKQREGMDATLFCYNARWEIDYLVAKICGISNNYTPKISKRAIRIACMASCVPKSRKRFLEQVMNILYLL